MIHSPIQSKTLILKPRNPGRLILSSSVSMTSILNGDTTTESIVDLSPTQNPIESYQIMHITWKQLIPYQKIYLLYLDVIPILLYYVLILVASYFAIAQLLTAILFTFGEL